jgi:hypothetical protein
LIDFILFFCHHSEHPAERFRAAGTYDPPALGKEEEGNEGEGEEEGDQHTGPNFEPSGALTGK